MSDHAWDRKYVAGFERGKADRERGLARSQVHRLRHGAAKRGYEDGWNNRPPVTATRGATDAARFSGPGDT